MTASRYSFIDARGNEYFVQRIVRSGSLARRPESKLPPEYYIARARHLGRPAPFAPGQYDTAEEAQKALEDLAFSMNLIRLGGLECV